MCRCAMQTGNKGMGIRAAVRRLVGRGLKHGAAAPGSRRGSRAHTQTDRRTHTRGQGGIGGSVKDLRSHEAFRGTSGQMRAGSPGSQETRPSGSQRGSARSRDGVNSRVVESLRRNPEPS